MSMCLILFPMMDCSFSCTVRMDQHWQGRWSGRRLAIAYLLQHLGIGWLGSRQNYSRIQFLLVRNEPEKWSGTVKVRSLSTCPMKAGRNTKRASRDRLLLHRVSVIIRELP